MSNRGIKPELDQPLAAHGISESAWNLHQQIARNDYLGETGQTERDLGWLALLVSELAERVQELEEDNSGL